MQLTDARLGAEEPRSHKGFTDLQGGAAEVRWRPFRKVIELGVVERPDLLHPKQTQQRSACVSSKRAWVVIDRDARGGSLRSTPVASPGPK